LPVLTAAEFEAWLLQDLADARHEVRRMVILQLLPHWTRAGRLFLEQYEREARQDVRVVLDHIAHYEMRSGRRVKRSSR
jgi:hypothetical protein